MIDLVRFSTFVGCPMGDVIWINYPAIRKYIALARREIKKNSDEYSNKELDDLLGDLDDDTFSKALEEDERIYAERNRLETNRNLNGDLISLWRYRGIREFINWFQKQHALKGNGFQVRLSHELEHRTLEAHDIAKLLQEVNNNINPEYLSRVERAVKDFLIIETALGEKFLRDQKD